MILTFEQVQAIVKNNPNKAVIAKGREMAKRLLLHTEGVGTDEAIKHSKYFANDDLYTEQKSGAISNKDTAARLLQQEEMIFSVKGGSTHFNLPDSEESEMNILISDVRDGFSLRKWVQDIALKAYRSDPMGIIFMEAEPLSIDENGQMNEPKAYPTYQSSEKIYDYQTTGRKLEYVCFQLSVAQCNAYGIQDESLKGMQGDKETYYFRIVDDRKDLIVVKKDGDVFLVSNITQKNPLPNNWGRVPGFVISDLVQFNNTKVFLSPLETVVELFDCFLDDRSVRNLQKKLHGFAKAVEPLLSCPTCIGTGFLSANPCPSCTPAGGDKGTGYKLKTKPSDVLKFPLSILEEGNFDFRKILGYATTDIATWEKQDASLSDLEELIEMTYWGTVRMKRPQPGKEGEPITATEVSSNDAPKEARLNKTADWAESTENAIADFIGQYWFEKQWKGSSIAYARDYILKTADDYKNIYIDLKTKGAPDSALDNAFRKWKQAEFQSNDVKGMIEIQKFMVEPFPHLAISQAKGIITDFNDYNCKLYFGEWANTIPDAMWINKKPDELRKMLKEYVNAKGIKEPEPEAVPSAK